MQQQYNQYIAEVIFEKHIGILKEAKNGHCMKLQGVSNEVLHDLLERFRQQAPNIDIFILSQKSGGDFIDAFGLIELRNHEEHRPLLVLRPSNLRTAAEDSYGNATFTELTVDDAEDRLFDTLKSRLPADLTPAVHTIFDYLGKDFPVSLKNKYLIHFLEDTSQEALGKYLYLLGLFPDSALLENPQLIKNRLVFNQQSIEVISQFNQTVFDRVNALPLMPNTLQKQVSTFLQENYPEKTAFGLVANISKSYPQLDFAHWKIRELESNVEVQVEVLDLMTVKGKGKLVRDKDGELTLVGTSNTPAKVNLKFTTQPEPKKVPEIAYFTVDLMRPVGPGNYEQVVEMARFPISKAARKERTKEIEFDPNNIEAGAYFFRMTAFDANGVPLNINDDFRDANVQREWLEEKEKLGKEADRSKFKGKLISDSEGFIYELDDSDEGTEGDVVEREVKDKVANLMHGIFTCRMDYLKRQEDASGVGRDEEHWHWLSSDKAHLHSIFNAKFSDPRYNFQIEVSTKLKEAQLAILRNPEKTGTVQFYLSPSGRFQAEHLHLHSRDLFNSNKLARFQQARQSLFNAILEDITSKDGVFETFDLNKHKDLAENYVKEYLALTTILAERIPTKLNDKPEDKRKVLDLTLTIQNLDLVQIKTQLPNQEWISAWLIPPIHPLRIAWFLQMNKTFSDWEKLTQENPKLASLWDENLKSVFTGGLYPTNIPLVLADYDNLNAYEYTGEICFGWGLYLKSIWMEKDLESMSARNRIILQYLRQQLNIRNQRFVENDLSFDLVKRHVRNYLSLHPYTEQLNINLFNAGEGNIFSDVLLDLEKESVFKSLRYEIRQFTNRDSIINHGDSFLNLLNPGTTQTEEAEKFSQVSESRLFPKLRFSLNSVQEYLQAPSKYEAHLSFLISPFPLRTKAYQPLTPVNSFHWGGLIVEPQIEVNYSEDRSLFSWARFIYSDNESAKQSSLTQMLTNVNALISFNLSGNFTSSCPATELQLLGSDTVLLDTLHEHSDWVITFDKHLGPEIFDLPNPQGAIPFLLDYIPGSSPLGVSSFLTTRPGEEIEALIIPYLQRLLGNTREDLRSMALMVLEDLRAISGSVILQLGTSPNKVLETIGIALTKRLLEKKGILSNQFIIPIDLHQDLFRENTKGDDPLSGKRADLLLAHLQPEKKSIHFQVIEIKCRTQVNEVGGLFVRDSLKTEIDAQLLNTVKTLRYHFDPMNDLIANRFDRPLKTKMLTQLLSFYLKRAVRYSLINSEEAKEGIRFISNLSEDYELTFIKRGIVFELEADFSIEKEQFEDDLMYYYVGKNAIADILNPDSELNSYRSDIKTAVIERDFSIRTEKIIVEEIFKQEMEDLEVGKSGEKVTAKGIIDDDFLSGTVTKVEPFQAPEVEITGEQAEFSPPNYDVYIGDDKPSQQYGLLGRTIQKKKIALDLNGTNTISLFGVQGAGKSYTLGTIAEMVLKPIHNINAMIKPLAGVIFHYSESQDYKPEFTTMRYPNDQPKELEILNAIYDAKPDAIQNIVLLVPHAKLDARKAEYPNLEVLPLAFSSRELNIGDWRFLMGAPGNQSLYMKQVNNLMRTLRGNITLESLENAIEETGLLNPGQKELAFSRLSLAREYLNDEAQLGSLIEPGRLVIVDLRDEFIEQDDALGLFVIMLNIFANAKAKDGKVFNKFIVFDEAHKYMNNRDLTSNIVTAIREMRHKGVSLLIASQDPPSLPTEIIELSSILLMHKFNSPQWLRHIQKSVTQAISLTPGDLSALSPGEAFLWASKSNIKSITQQPVKIQTRPRVTKHGGGTVNSIA